MKNGKGYCKYWLRHIFGHLSSIRLKLPTNQERQLRATGVSTDIPTMQLVSTDIPTMQLSSKSFFFFFLFLERTNLSAICNNTFSKWWEG
jgi:hypothetical protein